MSAFRLSLLLLSLSLLVGSGCRSLHLKEGARDYKPETAVGDGEGSGTTQWRQPINDPNDDPNSRLNSTVDVPNVPGPADGTDGIIDWPHEETRPLEMTPLVSGIRDDSGGLNVASDKYTVYFSYDKSDIGASERVKLDSLAAFLTSSPSARVVIQGHCDERGSEEYNRALGERRAIVVRDYLASVGVDQSRMETLSFGEEKPAEAGTTEAAYQKNRRAEFQISVPPGAGGR